MNSAILSYKQVLEEFDKNNISYCLLRNYEFLDDPSYLLEGLDTLIAKKDISKAHGILLNLNFTKRKPQFSQAHHAYFKLVNLQKVSFDIQVGGIHWNDMSYLSEMVLKERINKQYYYLLSDKDTFIMLLVHSILGKRFFKEKYQKILHKLITNQKVNEQEIKKELSLIFNPKIAQELIIKVKTNQFNKINIPFLLLFFLIKQPSRVATLTLLFFRWLRWKRIFTPAPLISIIGPDGAGKSTLTKELNNYLTKTKRSTTTIYTGRGRNHILPFTTLGRIYKSREKKNDAMIAMQQTEKNEINQQKISNKRKILYLLSAFLFTMDLLLRYYLTIFLVRFFQRKMVITDRYCSDIILMNHVPYKLKKILYSLFPKPTITIFLYNTPEILHQRRPEEPIAELQRQMAIFEKLNYSLKIKTIDEQEDRKKAIEFVTTKLLHDWY